MDNKENEVEEIQNAQGPNLRDAFVEFRKKRVELRRQLSASSRAAAAARPVISPEVRCDPARMQALREKFIQTAMKYIGTPYAKKYCTPDSPQYNSPLFLDCCGLVRQAQRDLADEFGFRLGRWNQCYQFDTLPVRYSSHTELKPGDLIFYTATFYEHITLKPQKHGLVHVEIFLGGESGESTVASRSARGTVQVYDSFRFVSQNYHSVQHYFCSLDPWLRGECTSHCALHPWREPETYDPGVRSIFNFEDDDDENCNADDENTSNDICASTSTTTPSPTTDTTTTTTTAATAAPLDGDAKCRGA
eukprot:gnl/Spiro4/25891_TR12895_c0_g1_i1.p1 gnl/Spiro4/25891_TR12895_c0_g1~~gnl/Spiro4/25891_TR12895_c0_g1_i1.p1  ORF type:complete len:305 (-),score=60.98 gnl/Spiro4/25891_TR12895_c0_g1_i1:115-1029(-)